VSREVSPPPVGNRIAHPFRIMAVFALFVLFATSCAATDNTNIGTVASQFLADTEASSSEPAACVFEDAQPAVREWNRAAGDLIVDYLDPSVTADKYIQTSKRLLPTLEQVVYDLQDVRDCMNSFDQGYMRRLASLYSREVTALQALETAIRVGSYEGEQNAVKMIEAATAEKNDLACEIVRLAGGDATGLSC